MSLVEFGTPPRQRTRHLAREQAQELRAAPGDWAKIRTYPGDKRGQRAAHNYASHISNGRFPAFAGCEAYATTVDGEVQVWARYLNDATPN